MPRSQLTDVSLMSSWFMIRLSILFANLRAGGPTQVGIYAETRVRGFLAKLRGGVRVQHEPRHPVSLMLRSTQLQNRFEKLLLGAALKLFPSFQRDRSQRQLEFREIFL